MEFIFPITHRFKLTENFINNFKGKQPEWGYGVLSYVTYKRTYSRLKDDGTNEEFWETCRRVVEGVYSIQWTHCARLGLEWNAYKAQKSAQEMFTRMWQFKWLPPGRGLWMMGTSVVEKIGSAALNNCGFISTKNILVDPIRPFTFLMDFSMLGVGIGFDTLGANKLEIKRPRGESHFVIPDTREGWVTALQLTLSAYFFGGPKYEFDYSQIRPKGSPIKTFGGISSGPEPLINLINWLNAKLGNMTGQKLSSVDIVDIMNNIGKCVISGNVRRSAEIAIGQYDDLDFIDMKNPDKYPDELINWRWASNNSIFAKIGMDYTDVASRISKNGEPGLIWLDNIKTKGRTIDGLDNTDEDADGLNPCGEQVLESGELCCLVENYPAHHDNYEDFLQTLKYSYLYAKTVTLVPTHDPKVNAVMLRNRRIGCSMSGIEQAKNKFGYYNFYQKFCNLGFKRIQELDKTYSRWLCVPQSKRTTSVKPSGTISILAGASPGLHYPHSEYYYRTVRFDINSPLIPILKKAGYKIEEDITSPQTTLVVFFPIKEKNFNKSKQDVSIWEQMENVNSMQTWWSNNSVSATVTFKPEETQDLKRVIEVYETKLKAVSFLPLKEHNYKQAPYITITKEEYETAIKNIKKIDLSSFTLNEKDKKEEKFCDGEICTLS